MSKILPHRDKGAWPEVSALSIVGNALTDFYGFFVILTKSVATREHGGGIDDARPAKPG